MSQTESTEAFADDTPLVQLFGQPARARIISVLVDERTRELNVSEIARQAGVARSTVYDHLDDLVDLDVAVQVEDTGGHNRYQLSQESDIAELLYKLDGVVLQKLLNR